MSTAGEGACSGMQWRAVGMTVVWVAKAGGDMQSACRRGPPARDAWTESKNAPGHKNIAKEASTKFNSIFGELWEANFGLPACQHQ